MSDRRKGIVDEAAEAMGQLPVPDEIEGLSWPGLLRTLEQASLDKEHNMWTWHNLVPGTRLGKAFAAAACVLVAVTVGWGAQRLVKTFVFEEGSTTWVVKSDDPDMTEDEAREVHEQIQQAIADGRCTLLRIENTEQCSVYVYECTLADGRKELLALNHPLDPETKRKLDEEMEKAVAEGSGELVSVTELESGLTVYRYKVILSDGSVRTYASNMPPREREEKGE